MSPLIGSATADLLRSTLDRVFLNHTYTRTPISAGTEDSEGNAAPTAGTPVLLVPCKYEVQQRARVDESGRTIVYAPSIKVSHDDPLTEGDLVSAITDPGDSQVLLAGPLTVVSVVPLAGLGPELQKRATLQAGKVTL